MLSSNVLNYLVWRYLQEAGYGNAALQLSRCWNRDPESLPFAKNVSQHTLINLLQDGLWFDKLQAEAGNGQHRYNFGRDHGRPYSVPNGTLLTLDKGIPAHELAEAASTVVQQEPPPRKVPGKKKKGKVNGIDSRMHHQVNGDAMDVDQNGNTNVTNSVRAESEAVVSDADSPTVAEIPISTLSIGQSTEIQTEVVTDLVPETLFSCSVKDPDRLVTETLWGPPEMPVFITAGKSLLRFHLISKGFPADSSSPSSSDPELPLNNYSVTALCWNSQCEVIISAQEEIPNELGEINKTHRLFKLIDGGSTSQDISTSAGLVTTLRWNDPKQVLLATASDGQQGSIKLWKSPGNSQEPTWSSFTESAIYEAVWISETSFIVCGIAMLRIYEIGENLTVQHSIETQVTWEKVKYEPRSNIIATIGVDGQTCYLGILNLSDPTNLHLHEYPDPYLTDVNFRPAPSTMDTSPPTDPLDAPPPVQLATCATSGIIRVWDANRPFNSIKRLPTVDESQAHSVAFSPDGSLLAAAGPDSVTVWDIDRRDMPLATWRAQDISDDSWDATVDGETTIGWDPDGSKLSIVLGNQVAIIPVPR
ncbi:WD40-repeat-containing domain protein [Dendryphion nanum]|uniref:WD40-repeat-containing domain protein n=1 Tax=Dendryphion nanum TaxID=256645 RepID=A0A9P9DD78_9PLEO|nr:WD40-repeat-containing domain protein [Dendryphion nanum]